MTETATKNGHREASEHNTEHSPAPGEILSPDELTDLVAEAVVEKLQENSKIDAFLDDVISRVFAWRRDMGLRPVVPRMTRIAPGLASGGATQGAGPTQHRQLYYKHENDPFSEIKTKVLISSFDNASREGGIFELDFRENSICKVFHTNGRGLSKYRDGYLLVSRNGGFFHLDFNFSVLAQYDLPNLDLHGVECGPDGLIYIVETKRNRVGIYQLEPFERVDEIVITDEEEDRHHLNDLYFRDGKLLLSMFSTREPARGNFENGIFDGAIIEYDLITKKPIRRLAENLRMPHTIKFVGDNLCYCESHALSMVVPGKRVAQFSGYTRGLDFDGRFFYIGQSCLRHQRTHNKEFSLSNDAGIHILDTKEGGTRFIPIPCTNIYAVLIIENPNDRNER